MCVCVCVSDIQHATMPTIKLKELEQKIMKVNVRKMNCREGVRIELYVCKFHCHPHLTCRQLPLMHSIFSVRDGSNEDGSYREENK